MKETQLSGTYRTQDFGTQGARRLRRQGRIPAVLYGHRKEPVHISLDEKEFKKKRRHISESTLLEITVDGEKYTVLMKDYQENLLLDRILHVDFFEVTGGEALRTHVPIILQGQPVGAKYGGIIDQVTHEIEVECLPQDLPETIVVNISELGLNESIEVAAVSVPTGVRILTHPQTTIATVKSIKETVVAPPAEAAVATAEAPETPAAEE